MGKYQHSENIEVTFHNQKRVEVDFGNWSVDIAYSTTAPEPEADQQILTNRKPVPDGLDISSCWRLNILSDDPYPCMDHCNDFLIVCERICDSYEGVFVRDNISGTWF